MFGFLGSNGNEQGSLRAAAWEVNCVSNKRNQDREACERLEGLRSNMREYLSYMLLWTFGDRRLDKCVQLDLF